MNQGEEDDVGLQWDVGVSLVISRSPTAKPTPR